MPEQQRVAVLMVHVYGWTPIEVGRITGNPAVTVRSHLRCGLRLLRSIALAVPNGETDRFPDQNIDWVLFTAIDAKKHVVDAAGGLI